MKNIISIYKLPYIIATILIINSCKKSELSDPNYLFNNSDSASTKIGVYLDYGVFDVCKTNTENMLKEMKCNYTVINKDSILNGNLNHYKLLLMPGGDMWKYRDYLTSDGMEKIKEYINQGGGYFGICGGAYFAANKVVWRGWAGNPRINISMNGLNLFSGTADGPIEDFAPSYVDSKCKIKIIDSTHPIAKDVPNIIEPYYDHGPMFLANDDSIVTILGKTMNGNKNVIILFQYNTGKVFLTGLHPEADVAHSSWVMVKNAMLWCSSK